MFGQEPTFGFGPEDCIPGALFMGDWTQLVGKCVVQVGSSRCGIVVGVLTGGSGSDSDSVSVGENKDTADTDMELTVDGDGDGDGDGDDVSLNPNARVTGLRVRYADGVEANLGLTEVQIPAGKNGTLGGEGDVIQQLSSYMQNMSAHTPTVGQQHQQHQQQQQHQHQQEHIEQEEQKSREQEQQLEQQHQRRQAARERMQQQNMNQLQLASMLGLSQPMISKWINSACSSKIVHEKLTAWLNDTSRPQAAGQVC